MSEQHDDTEAVLQRACQGEMLVRVLSFLTVRDATRWSWACRAFHASIPSHLAQALELTRAAGYYPALGDELVWQRLCRDEDSDNGFHVDWQSLVSDDHARGWSFGEGIAPRTCLGPTMRPDALDVSQVGMAIRLAHPIRLGTEWTVCAWTLIANGQPLREDFVQPDGWIPGEHALVGSPGDDQHVFYSVGRGGWLGCYCQDLDEAGYEENLAILDPEFGEGFFSSQYSFQNLKDGWHFVVAVGSRWRLGMGWTAEASNGNGSTRFYLDGEYVGSTPFNLLEPVQYIGNVSGDGDPDDQTQPWGMIADFSMYRRSLTPEELKSIMIRPVPAD